MKLRRLLYLFVIVSGMNFVFVNAQDLSDPLTPAVAPPRIYVGPVAGYNRVFQTGQFPSIAGDALCPFFKDGSGNGFYAGVSLEMLLGDPKTSTSSLIFRAIYNNLPFSVIARGDNLPSLVVQDGKQTVIKTSTQHSTIIKYTTIDFEAMYRFNLGKTPIGIIAGPVFGIPITKTLTQKFELTDPPEAQFIPKAGTRYENFNRVAILQEGDIAGASAIRIALKAGVQYEINLRKMVLIPSINYNFGLTEVASGWRINAIQAGVDLRFAL